MYGFQNNPLQSRGIGANRSPRVGNQRVNHQVPRVVGAGYGLNPSAGNGGLRIDTSALGGFAARNRRKREEQVAGNRMLGETKFNQDLTTGTTFLTNEEIQSNINNSGLGDNEKAQQRYNQLAGQRLAQNATREIEQQLIGVDPTERLAKADELWSEKFRSGTGIEITDHSALATYKTFRDKVEGDSQQASVERGFAERRELLHTSIQSAIQAPTFSSSDISIFANDLMELNGYTHGEAMTALHTQMVAEARRSPDKASRILQVLNSPDPETGKKFSESFPTRYEELVGDVETQLNQYQTEIGQSYIRDLDSEWSEIFGGEDDVLGLDGYEGAKSLVGRVARDINSIEGITSSQRREILNKATANLKKATAQKNIQDTILRANTSGSYIIPYGTDPQEYQRIRGHYLANLLASDAEGADVILATHLKAGYKSGLPIPQELEQFINSVVRSGETQASKKLLTTIASADPTGGMSLLQDPVVATMFGLTLQGHDIGLVDIDATQKQQKRLDAFKVEGEGDEKGQAYKKQVRRAIYAATGHNGITSSSPTYTQEVEDYATAIYDSAYVYSTSLTGREPSIAELGKIMKPYFSVANDGWFDGDAYITLKKGFNLDSKTGVALGNEVFNPHTGRVENTESVALKNGRNFLNTLSHNGGVNGVRKTINGESFIGLVDDESGLPIVLEVGETYNNRMRTTQSPERSTFTITGNPETDAQMMSNVVGADNVELYPVRDNSNGLRGYTILVRPDWETTPHDQAARDDATIQRRAGMERYTPDTDTGDVYDIYEPVFHTPDTAGEYDLETRQNNAVKDIIADEVGKGNLPPTASNRITTESKMENIMEAIGIESGQNPDAVAQRLKTGFSFIANQEGSRNKSYDDGVGVRTIGTGVNLKLWGNQVADYLDLSDKQLERLKSGDMKLTDEQADDVSMFIWTTQLLPDLKKRIPDSYDLLTQSEFSAVASRHYQANNYWGKVGSSSLAKYIQSGRTDVSAATELAYDWLTDSKGKYISRRRRELVEFFGYSGDFRKWIKDTKYKDITRDSVRSIMEKVLK